jgi:hypothetical protein
MGSPFARAAAMRQKAVVSPPRDRPAPMTLGKMRSNGVRAIIAECLDCRHKADVVVDELSAEVFVPDVGRRMVNSACGGQKIETRPAWHLAKRPGTG